MLSWSKECNWVYYGDGIPVLKIWIRFEGSHDEFYDWLEINLKKLRKILNKYGYTCDISYSDKILFIFK